MTIDSNMPNIPTLADDIANGPKNKCANCGHDVMIYRHQFGSSELMFHNNSGVFAKTCACGCKNPKTNIQNLIEKARTCQ